MVPLQSHSFSLQINLCLFSTSCSDMKKIDLLYLFIYYLLTTHLHIESLHYFSLYSCHLITQYFHSTDPHQSCPTVHLYLYTRLYILIKINFTFPVKIIIEFNRIIEPWSFPTFESRVQIIILVFFILFFSVCCYNP